MHQGVFLTVQRLDFQRREHFSKSHGDRIRADGFPGVQGHRVGHYTNFQTSHVFQLGHAALAVGQIAKAHAGPGQTDQTSWFNFLENLLGRRTIQHGVDLFFVLEHERQVPHLHFLDAGREGCQRTNVKLLRARLNGLQLLFIAAQNGAVVSLQLDIAFGVGPHQFGKLIDGGGLRMALRHGMTDLSLDLGKGRTGTQRKRSDGHQRNATHRETGWDR